MLDILKTVLFAGIGAGIIAAGGYFKNTKKEDWSWMKFVKTTLLSIILALGAQLTGMSPDVLASSAFGVTLDLMIENWLKALFRDKSILRNSI